MTSVLPSEKAIDKRYGAPVSIALCVAIPYVLPLRAVFDKAARDVEQSSRIKGRGAG